jgi:hypothetical protein
LIVAINASIRHDDEWFDEPDELDRIERLLEQLKTGTDPVVVLEDQVVSARGCEVPPEEDGLPS